MILNLNSYIVILSFCLITFGGGIISIMIRQESITTHIDEFDIWDRFSKLRLDKKIKDKNNFFLMNPDLSLMELISEAHGGKLNISVAVDNEISYETYNRIKNYTPYNGIDSLELYSIPEIPRSLNHKDTVIILSGFRANSDKTLIRSTDLEKLSFYSNFFSGEVLLYLIREEEVMEKVEKWIAVDTNKYFTHII